MALKGFYSDANNGENSAPIWIASFCLILAGFYFILGAFSVILSTFTDLIGINWHPSIYMQNIQPEFIRYYWAVFYDWVPGTLLTLWALHYAQTKLRKRPFLKIITAAKAFRWKRLFAAAFVFGVLQLCYLTFMYFYPTGPEPAFWSEAAPKTGLDIQKTGLKLSWFLAVLPLLLVIVPINAFMQEVVFRGFIDQALTHKFKQTLPAFIISAIAFSLWHIYNYEIAFGAVPYLIGMFIFGFSMSVITANDEGIEAAIGIHTANNLFSTLGIGVTIIILPDTFLYSFGEPKFTAGTVLIDLLMFSLTTIILSKWKFDLSKAR